jgi:hypothetical protein
MPQIPRFRQVAGYLGPTSNLEVRVRKFVKTAVLATSVVFVATACWSPSRNVPPPTDSVTTPEVTASDTTTPSTPDSPTTTPTTTPGTSPTPTPTPSVTETGSPSDLASIEPTQNKATAEVSMTFLGWIATGNAVEASGVVTPLEDSGVCRLVLTKGDTSVDVSASALPDAQTMACGGGLSIPGSKLSTGLWTATLEYDSPTSHGVSAPMTVPVP